MGIQIYIDSDNRLDKSTTTSSNFTFSIENIEKYNRVVVTSVEVPKSYYLINSGQSFSIFEDATEYQVTVEPGNYSLYSLLLNLNTSLAAIGTYTYVASYPSNEEPNTGKITITATDYDSVKALSLSCTLDYARCLGYDENVVYPFTAGAITSIKIIQLDIDTILIHSDIRIPDQNTNNIICIVNSNNTPQFNYIHYENRSSVNYFELNNSKNVYRFWVTDNDNNLINLNGLELDIVLHIYNDDSQLTNLYLKKLVQAAKLQQMQELKKNIEASRTRI